MNKKTNYPGSKRSLIATAVAMLLPTLVAAQDPSQGTVVVADEGEAVAVAEGDRMPVIVTGDELVEGWRYELTLYGWAKSLEGQSRGRDVELDFVEDILDMLDMAGMVSFEAEYGRWLGFAAYEYSKIGVEEDDLNVTLDLPTGGAPPLPPTLPARVQGEFEASDPQHMFEIGAGYKVLDGENLDITLHGGIRYYDYDLELTLRNATATLPPPIGQVEIGRRKLNIADDWWQPFVGARFATHLSDSWRLRGRFDYGYGSEGDTNEMWMAEIKVDWRFNDWGALELGYRYLENDYDNGSSSDPYSWDMTERGPIVGLIIHF